MLACAHCGSKNSEGLKFCQDCGQKLGPPGAAVAPPVDPDPRRGIPDTGIRASAPPVGPVLPCPRCHVDNRPGMNFCKMCGALLPRPAAEAAAAPPPAAQTVVVKSVAPAEAPRRAVVVETPAAIGPICPRCRGANTHGAEFCRFCGTPLSGSARSPAAAAPAPDPRPPPAASPLAGIPGFTIERDTVVAPSPSPPEPAPSAPVAAPAGPTLSASASPAIAAPAPAPVRTDAMPAFRIGGGNGGATPAPAARKGTEEMGATLAPAIAQLTTIQRDGSEGRTYPLVGEQTDIGREEGNILLPDDPYLCPRHARIVRRDGRFHLRDLESVNGVYLRVSGPHELCHGDAILLGQELLVFELLEDAEVGLGPAIQHGTLVFGTPELPRLARLCQLTTEGVPRDLYHLHRTETIIGREVGDIVFTDDAFLSRRHASVTLDPATRRFSLRDVDSSNGTYVRFRGERELRFGDRFRVGQHLFRFERVGGE